MLGTNSKNRKPPTGHTLVGRWYFGISVLRYSADFRTWDPNVSSPASFPFFRCYLLVLWSLVLSFLSCFFSTGCKRSRQWEKPFNAQVTGMCNPNRDGSWLDYATSMIPVDILQDPRTISSRSQYYPCIIPAWSWCYPSWLNGPRATLFLLGSFRFHGLMISLRSDPSQSSPHINDQ